MEDKFSLPESGWEMVKRIIQALFRCSKNKPVGLSEIARTGGLNKTLVSRNNSFLKSVAIAQGGKAFELTEIGKELALGIDHGDLEKIEAALKKLVSQNEFLTRILDAVKIRNGMDLENLTGHIAISAGVPKVPRFLTGARAVVEMLLEAKLLQKDNNTLKVVESVAREAVLQEEPKIHVEKEEVTRSPRAARGGVNININIHVSFEELKTQGELLKERVRDLLNELE